MKTLFLITLLFVFSPFIYAQEEIIVDDPEIFTLVEKMPSWKGCEEIITEAERNNCTFDKIMNFLVSETKYPATAKDNGTQGVVYISFVIDTAGNVTTPKILRGVSPELDEEALRVVSQMPAWNAGMQRGKYVSVAYNMPINFKLAGKSK
jgi:protein TonB